MAWASRLFAGSQGGSAKVAVVSSGLLGSLSGSAVANAAATGTFTIPLMRSAGFSAAEAAGITAAASSGGALMPPVMGAGAYMMLEIIDPPVTYLEIIRAAFLPGVLYYFSLLALVHLHSRRRGVAESPGPAQQPGSRYPGLVFAVSLGALIVLIVAGYTVFRAGASRWRCSSRSRPLGRRRASASTGCAGRWWRRPGAASRWSRLPPAWGS